MPASRFAARIARIGRPSSVRSEARAARREAPAPSVPGFESVGEAMASERGVTLVSACEVLGRRLADDGVDLVTALDGLGETSRRVTGGEPPFDAVSALAGAWSEATLGYVHALGCEEPLSGTATLAHLRTRLAELYRARGEGVHTRHGLVVVELGLQGEAPLDTALRVARVAGLARTVWQGEETIARSARRRLLVLVDRDEALGRRLRLLRELLDTERLWVEGLPHSEASAAALLDELARA